MIGIINKQLLLQLVGVYIIYVNGAWLNRFQVFEGALKFFVSGILPVIMLRLRNVASNDQRSCLYFGSFE
jgi:hypothetical protein